MDLKRKIQELENVSYYIIIGNLLLESSINKIDDSKITFIKSSVVAEIGIGQL